MYGLRNPWRFSFDRATGDLWIGDVGQNAIEEIDFLPPARPAGRTSVGATSRARTRTAPTATRWRACRRSTSTTTAAARCSVTGGYVYRGNAIPALQGTYLFADYCRGEIHGLVRRPATAR